MIFENNHQEFEKMLQNNPYLTFNFDTTLFSDSFA